MSLHTQFLAVYIVGEVMVQLLLVECDRIFPKVIGERQRIHTIGYQLQAQHQLVNRQSQRRVASQLSIAAMSERARVRHRPRRLARHIKPQSERPTSLQRQQP